MKKLLLAATILALMAGDVFALSASAQRARSAARLAAASKPGTVCLTCAGGTRATTPAPVVVAPVDPAPVDPVPVIDQPTPPLVIEGGHVVNPQDPATIY